MKKPNILVYFTDQQRADTCGCFGQPLDWIEQAEGYRSVIE